MNTNLPLKSTTSSGVVTNVKKESKASVPASVQPQTIQSDDVGTTEAIITEPINASVLKSLLKKSSSLTSSPKHNRNVSFNQTVIVFCEETESPLPEANNVDHEPPLEYQDSLTTFEPPRDYCDEIDELDHVDGPPPYGDLVVQEHATSKDDSSIERNIKVSKPSSSFFDDSLIGLHWDKSLSNTFKFDISDLPKKNSPAGLLNGNHSHLSNDAVSDSGSECDSSFYLEEKSLDAVTCPAQTTSNTQAPIANLTINKISAKNNENYKCNNDTFEIAHEMPVQNQKLVSTYKSNAQKTMAARIKVSTVDHTNSRRQPKRKDEIDLTSSSAVSFNYSNEQNLHQHSQEQISQKPAQSDDNRPSTLIKQSTFELITQSKPIVVNHTYNEQNQPQVLNSTESNEISLSSSSKSCLNDRLIDDLKTDSEEPREFNRNAQRMHQYQTFHNPKELINGQSQPSCQICNVIQNNRSKMNTDVKDIVLKDNPIKVSGSNDVVHRNVLAQLLSYKPITSLSNENQPAVFNQSCPSCREALVKHHLVQDEQPNTSTNPASQPKPVTYQIVYIVDSNGNRVKAVSVRPAGVNLTTHKQLPSDRVFIAKNRLQFPNPSQLDTKQDLPQAPPWILYCGVNPPQHRFISTNNGQNSNNQPTLLNPVIGQVSKENLGARQPTVHHVERPIDSQKTRQPLSPTCSSSKSFTNLHEINRLDGLTAPSVCMNLTSIRGHSKIMIGRNQPVNEVVENNARLSTDEVDDPSFGFSNRPPVKVVTSIINRQNPSKMTTQQIT